ncbi:MAG TPA: TRAP transporter small permease [Desulfatiglandales bacterium]|nr:TRAP transporter small permease [Desulfatiglandales bacterium]
MRTSNLSSVYDKIKKLNVICATLSGLVLLFVTFSIFVDVILRYFFNRPSIWVTEITTYLFLYIIFLGTAYALQEGMHIRVTFLVDRFNDKSIRIINLATAIFAMIFSFVLLWETSEMTWYAFKEKWTSPTMLNAPYAYIYVVMVFGSFLLVVTFLCDAALKFRDVTPEKETEKG